MDIKRRIDKSKLRVMMDPATTFFANLLALLKLDISTDFVPTAGVDGVTLFLNPEFVETLTDDELLGLLLHEVGHVAFDHIVRCNNAGLDKQIYNHAGDHVINLFLVARGYTLPPNALCAPRFTNMSTRAVYDILKAEAPPPEDAPIMYDLMNPGGDDTPLSDEEAIMVQSKVLSAAIQAELGGEAGSIPGEIKRKLKEFTEPKLPWHQILQNYMISMNKEDFTWRRPNRRYMPDFYLPTREGEALEQISVAYDVSGSISKEQFQEIMSEIKYIWDTLQPEKMRIMAFDTRITSDVTLTEGDDMKDIDISGGGGTNLGDVFKTLKNDQPELCLIFTDGHVNVPKSHKILSDLIWIIHDNPHWKTKRGLVIHLDPNI